MNSNNESVVVSSDNRSASPVARSVDRSKVPELMRKASSKRILNPPNLSAPTKTLRMKSLLWVKPTVTQDQLSTSSVAAQLFPTLLVNLAAISSGLSLAYSAITLPQLKPYLDHLEGGDGVEGHKLHMYRPFIIDEEQGSWIASIFGVGAIFGGFLSGYLGSQLGCRKALLIMTLPDILGWCLIAGSQNIPMMLLGRFLNGLSAAGYAPAIQVYVSEIAQPHHRGWLSAITVPTLGFGSLLAYVLGSEISWHWVAAMGAVFPVLLIPGLIYLSDSPYWYIQKGDEKKALQVMERFRSANCNSLAELLAISDFLRNSVDHGRGITIKEGIEKMMERQYRRPFLILNLLFLLMTFSGKFAISFYAVEIFHKATEAVNEYHSAIITGLIRLIGALLYIPAIKMFSRRSLLCCSSLVMGTSLVVLGLAVYSHENPLHSFMPTDLYWLPLLCVTIYTVADPLGLGSIPFLYTAEFFPSEMRSLLSGVTIGLSNLEMFLVVKTFPDLTDKMGSHGAFWLYAGVCFATVVYVLLFVPETRGKTLQEIESNFAFKESLHVTPYVTPASTPAMSKRGPQRGLADASLQFTL